MAWYDSLGEGLQGSMGYQQQAGGFVLDPGDMFGNRASAQGAAQQYAAQLAALGQQQGQFQQMFDYNKQQTGLGIGYTQQFGQQGANTLSDYYNRALGQYGMGQIALGTANQNSLDALASGYGTAQKGLQGLADLGRQYGPGAAKALGATSSGGPYDTLSQVQQSDFSGPGKAGNALASFRGSGPAYDVTRQQSGLASMIGQGQQLGNQMNAQTSALAGRMTQGVDLQADPGYAFRQQQGEQALNRSAAAQGGRLGGAQLKALADYNSGLASQEYGNAFNRQQQTNQSLMQLQGQGSQQQLSLLGQQYGAAGNVDQMRQEALFNQAGRTDQAGQFNAQQYNAMLQDQASRGDTMALDALRRQDTSSQFNAGQFNAALGDYASQSNMMGLDAARRQDAMNAQAQQNQYGLAQLGYGAQNQLAQLGYQYGGQQADLYGQYGQQLMNLYGQKAGLSSQTGNNLAQLYANMGSNMGNIATGSAGSNTSLSNQLSQAYQNFAQYGGMQQQNQANSNRQTTGMLAQLGGTLGAAYMASDVRVKEDIRDATTDTVSLLDSLRAVKFRYAKPAQYGEGEWLGIIAQDLLQTPMGAAMVVKAPDGTLMVDIRKAVSALLGSVVVLQNEVMELRGRLDKVRG